MRAELDVLYSLTGELTEEFCEKIDCGLEIHYADELRRGCAPVYYEHSCCPITWKCRKLIPAEHDIYATIYVHTIYN